MFLKYTNTRDVGKQVLLSYGMLISVWKSFARHMKICLKDYLLSSILLKKKKNYLFVL